MRPWLLALLLVGCSPTPEPPEARDGFPKEVYVFRLKGAPADAVSAAKGHPGFRIKELPDGRIEAAWAPDYPKDWEALIKRFEGKQPHTFLRDLMVIPGKLGNTEFTHESGGIGGWGGHTFRDAKSPLRVIINFNDYTTGGNEVMMIHGMIGPSSEEIRHDMLRYVVGDPAVRVQKCGDGYVLVAREGAYVTWQVNDQSFAKIYNSFDPEMVAAYVNRLGSTIPAGFKVDTQKWIEDEIRQRALFIDCILEAKGWAAESGGWTPENVNWLWRDITVHFPDVYRMKGFLSLDRGLSKQQLYDELLWVRHWLWANRENFHFDPKKSGFVLVGPDRYDPEHPPELPEEMRHLPKPPEDVP